MRKEEFENVVYNGVPTYAIYYGNNIQYINITLIAKHYNRRIDLFWKTLFAQSIPIEHIVTERGKGGGTYLHYEWVPHFVNWCIVHPMPIIERFEISFFKGLKIILTGLPYSRIQMIPQYPVLKYRIDCYIPLFRLAIEYDEEYHGWQEEKDDRRETEIQDALLDKISFIRINKGQEYQGYARILEHILQGA